MDLPMKPVKFRNSSAYLLVILLLSLTIVPQSAYLQMLVSDEDLSAATGRQCTVDCSQEKARPVCGSDGRTYGSRCDLERQVCQGNPVQQKHPGKCSEESRCRAERTHSQKLARRSKSTVFIPECREDGSFTPVQCHRPTGYCWCVTESGKPIPGSSVMHKKPNCNQQGKANAKRRSSPGKKEKDRKGCSQVDRKTFNENLLKIFITEFNRLPTTTPTAATRWVDGVTEARRVLDWKFVELDRNGDRELDRRELRPLKRMVKKIVRPRPCARAFTRACDQNQDRRVSRSEWVICLSTDFNNEQAGQADRGTAAVSREGMDLPLRSKQSPALGAHVRPVDTNLKTTTDDESPDCMTERQTALDEQRQLETKHFVPECTADGKYNKVQCFKQYCWCVEQENGKTIRGKPALNETPECEGPFPGDKSIKGCPERKKDQFLLELMNVLHRDMVAANFSKEEDGQETRRDPLEAAANWKFGVLDANSNKVIDRKEWRDFKTEIKKKKTLRKCGRNFLKYCDDNADKKVTSEEWVTCLGLKGKRNHNPTARKGKNPLIQYLSK